jgi:2-C-methyl-D-erythritol 4-phosphate cytidylyltransferase
MKNCAIIYTEPDKNRNSGDIPIHFKPIAGAPLLAHTLKAFEDCHSIDEIVIVTDEDFLLYVSESIVDRYDLKKVNKIRIGGDTRFKTIQSGLDGLAGDTEIVVIHDGLRPFITGDIISNLISECLTDNAVALGVQAAMPVKRAEQGYIMASLDKDRIFLMQSPQVFKSDLIKEAYKKAGTSEHVFADDAAVVESYGHKVRIFEGDKSNFRIVSDDDFKLARLLLENDTNRGVWHD